MTMLAQQGYDYTAIEDYAISERVASAAATIHVFMRDIGQSIITIGNELRVVKAQIPHGEWGKWLEAEFGWSDRQAQRFMKVSLRFEGKTDNLSDFGTSALYLLASSDDEVIDEAIERAENGEYISHAVAKKMVAERKQAAGVVWAGDETEAAPVQEQSEGRWETCNRCNHHKVVVHQKGDTITVYYGQYEDGAFICNHCLEQQQQLVAEEPECCTVNCGVCGQKTYIGNLHNGVYHCDECWEKLPSSTDREKSVAPAQEIVEELPPEVVYYKIYLFGIELAQHAKDAMHAIGKDILYRKSYTHHIPPEDELKNAVKRHFDNLYTVIADRMLFAETERE
jgi:hypothetical protein